MQTATVGTETDRHRMHNAQAQTARSLAVGTTTAAQTVSTALSMKDGSTMTGGNVFSVNVSTDTYLDRVNGLSDTSIQTEGRVVTASDHELLGTQLVASVLEAQQSAKALVQESAAFLRVWSQLSSIVNRKRIQGCPFCSD